MDHWHVLRAGSRRPATWKQNMSDGMKRKCWQVISASELTRQNRKHVRKLERSLKLTTDTSSTSMVSGRLKRWNANRVAEGDINECNTKYSARSPVCTTHAGAVAQQRHSAIGSRGAANGNQG